MSDGKSTDADKEKTPGRRPGTFCVTVAGTKFEIDNKYRIIKPIGHGGAWLKRTAHGARLVGWPR